MTDLVRGYRVCAYNEDDHEGVHIHHPINGRSEPTQIQTRSEAESIMRAYAEDHDWFDWKTFEECAQEWRFESRNG